MKAKSEGRFAENTLLNVNMQVNKTERNPCLHFDRGYAATNFEGTWEGKRGGGVGWDGTRACLGLGILGGDPNMGIF